MKIHLPGILPVILLCVHLSAYASDHKPGTTTDANISGHVLDAATKQHIPYVTIAVKGTTIGTVSDATGHYFLKNLPAGTFTLTASAVGYKSEETQVAVVKNKTQEVNFMLQEQAVDMEQVVVSANRNETNKKNTASIVNIMSTKLFENTASSNLAETLGFQSGLRVEYNCSNCGVPQLRINGLEGQYSQVLLDSRPIFSSLASVYGLEQMPAAMIERVEVIRGGGSALFGSNAIGGVVNIITKEPMRNSVTLANTTNILSRNSIDLNTSLNGSFVTDDRRAGVYLFGMVRDRDFYDRDGDGFSEIPQLQSETIGFRGYYKTGIYSKLTAEYHHMREFRRGGNKQDLPPHEADIAEQLRHKTDGGGLKFDLYSPNQRHRLNLYASAQVIDRDSYFGTEQNLDAYGATLDKTFVTGAQYVYSFKKLLFSPSDLTVGAEYNYNNLHDKMLGYGRDLKQISRIAGGYFQNEWKSEKVNFLIGGRLDKHNLVKNPIFSPRVNLRYSPSETIGLRASYSSGYRAPQAYDEDLHVAAVGGNVALIELAPDLKPEYSHSFSASADLYRKFGALQTNLLVEGFYTNLNNVFSLEEKMKDEQGNIIFERRNAAGATVKGINVEAVIGYPGKAELQMGYTYQQSRYKEAETWSNNPNLKPQKRMFRSPDHYGYITANVTVTKNFKTSVFGNYTGNMLVQHLEGYIAEDAETLTPNFWDLGLRLSYEIELGGNVRMEISGGIKNILDSFQKDIDKGVMRDAGYIYGPAMPRTFFFGIKLAI